jgi:hypothetical protein
MGVLKDLNGCVHGWCRVVGRADNPTDAHRLSTWRIQCRCERTFIARSDDWRAGRVSSCPDCRNAFKISGVIPPKAVKLKTPKHAKPRGFITCRIYKARY